MGHAVNPEKDYDKLQRHLDTMVTGAPKSATFMKILHLLFTPDEANLAHQLPIVPKTLGSISRSTKIPQDELDDSLTEMARKGLVMDLEIKGKRFFMLSPVVIGFFEYTFMRTRPDTDMKELAELFDIYMFQEGELAHSVFQKQTQIGRSLVHEEAIVEGDYSEILDWERATKIIETAEEVAVSLCACRHKAMHLGHACDVPLRTCLTLNLGVPPMVKAGLAEKISNKEALSILKEVKDLGMAQTGDNVKNGLTYMCNCCGCCCGMMNGIKKYNIKNAIVSSNWIMAIDLEKCKGCGKCAKACPIDAIEIKKSQSGNGKKKQWAERDPELCLGCGVCYSTCKQGAISMVARDKRVFTPETAFDKMVAMAIERGKLAPIIFDDPAKLSHRAMVRVISALEKSPPVKAAMAVKPLKSTFLDAVVKVGKARM